LVHLRFIRGVEKTCHPHELEEELSPSFLCVELKGCDYLAL